MSHRFFSRGRVGVFGLAFAASLGIARAGCNAPVGNSITCTGGAGATIADFSGHTFGTTTQASTYPAALVVSGAPAGATVSSVTLTLNGYTSTPASTGSSSADVGLLLEGPANPNNSNIKPNLQILRCAGTGGGSSQTNVTLTFQDGGTAIPPCDANQPGGGAWTASGAQTYEPSAYDATARSGEASPNYGITIQHSAQTLGTSTLASAFTGDVVNGTWNLYLVDDGQKAGISFTSWDITITYSAATTPSSTTLNANPTTAYRTSPNNSITLTANVTAGATGQVTFKDGSSNVSCSGANPAMIASNQATCSATFSTEGVHTITANYSGDSTFIASSGTANVFIQNHATNTSTTYCNSGTITNLGHSDTSYASTTPYPSVIFVGDGVNTDLPNSVSTVSVKLNSTSLGSNTSDLHMLLVAPDGSHAFDFWSDSTNVGSGTYTIVDGSPQLPSDIVSAGTYGPATYGSPQPDQFTPGPPNPAPQLPSSFFTAPPAGSHTFNTSFNGAPSHGAWSLYVWNGGGATTATIGGWCLDISPATGHPTTTTVGSNPTMATLGTPVTFTATVSSSPVVGSTGKVTFTENGTPIAGAPNNGVANVVGGVATITTSGLSEGDHVVTALYHDISGTYNDSFGSVTMRVDKATSTPTLNGGAWSYCNAGAVTIPAGTVAINDFGPATPNPSNIFVTNLPGTVSAVTLTMKSLHLAHGGNDLQSLLVGPNGASAPTSAQTFDFFSNVGNNTAFGPQDTTFGDTFAALPCGLTSTPPGATNAPTSCAGTDSFTSSAFYMAPGIQRASPVGAFTFNTGALTVNGGGVYAGTLANGTWSLFFNQPQHDTGSGLTNGWCLNFTENPVSVSVTKAHMGSNPMNHFVQGEQGAQFTVSVKNNGTGPTGDPDGNHPLTVTDTLDASFSYASSSGTDWSCSAVGQVVTCVNHDAIAENSSYPTLTINVNVSDTATVGTVNNTAGVSGGGTSGTTNGSDSVVIDPAPILAVAKSHPGTFTQGQQAEWDIVVSNTAAGSVTAGTTTISDVLPTGGTGYSLASYTSTNSSWTCSGTTTVTCMSTQVVAGGAAFDTLKLTVNVPANSPVSITNTANAWGGGDVMHKDSGHPAPGSDMVTVIQVPATVTRNGPSPQSTKEGGAFGDLSVTVKDAAGVVIPNYSTVTFSVLAGGTFDNGMTSKTADTDGSGVANPGTFTAGNSSATYNLTAKTSNNKSVTYQLINLAPPIGSVAFSPTTVKVNQPTTLTVTITNPNTPNIDASFTLGLPTNVSVAPTPSAANTCGGTFAPNPGDTTLTFSTASLTVNPCTVKVNVQASTDNLYSTSVTIDSTSAGNGSASAVAQFKAINPPNIVKSFGSGLTLPYNGTTTLTFTIDNTGNSHLSLSGITFTDNLPTAAPGTVVVAATPNLSDNCSGMASTPDIHTVTLAASSLSPGASCMVSVTVQGTAVGAASNSVTVSDTIAGTGNTSTVAFSVVQADTTTVVTGPVTTPVFGQSATFTATVASVVSGGGTPTGTVTFVVDSVTPGTTANLSGGTATFSTSSLAAGPHSIVATYNGDSNFNTSSNTAAPLMQTVNKADTTTGVTSSSPLNTSVFGESVTFTATVAASLPGAGTPTGSVTFVVDNVTPGTTASLSGGVATFATSALSVGSHTVVATYGGSTNFNGSNNNSSALTQTVNQGASVTMVSSLPNPAPVGQSVTFTATVAAMSPAMGTPTGMVTFSEGANTLGSNPLSGGVATFSTSSLTAGNHTITATYGGDVNFTGSMASLTSPEVIIAPPTLDLAFNPTAIALNSTSQLMFTVTNPAANTVALTNVHFSVTLPTGLTVTNGTSTQCGGTLTTTAPGTIALTGATVSSGNVAGNPCVFNVTVTGAQSGTYSGITEVGTDIITSDNGGTGVASTPVTLSVALPPTIDVAFGAASIPLSGTTSLTYTLTNPGGNLALTGVGFSDTLSTGLAPLSVGTNTCIQAPTLGAHSVQLTGVSLAMGASCMVTVTVQGTAAGPQMDSATPTATESGPGTLVSKSLLVIGPPTITATFTAATIPLNGNTNLNFTITNPNAQTTLTVVGFSETVASGLSVADASSSTCGGTLTVTHSSGMIQLANATVLPGNPCTFSVQITGIAAGDQNNTAGAPTSLEGGTGVASTQSTLKVVAPPTISKAFGATGIAVNGTTTLTFTLTNPGVNTTGLTGVGFSDTLTGGLQVASTPGVMNSCNGTVTATAGQTTISLNNDGSIPTPGNTCTIVVNVTGTMAGVMSNTTGAIGSSNGGTGVASNTVTLSVAAPPTLAVAFGASTVPLNQNTTLTYTITNPAGNIDLTGIAINDPLTGNLTTVGVASNNCAQTPTLGTHSVHLASLSLTVGNSCTFSITVQGSAAGAAANDATISSNESGTGATVIKHITVVAPPTISAGFTLSSIPLGGNTNLSLTLDNPNVSTTLTGIGFTNTLPAGLSVADFAATPFCGGTITVTHSTGVIMLQGGTLNSNASCQFNVPVTGIAAGDQVDTPGAPTSIEGGTGVAGSPATVNVVAPPTFSKAFSPPAVPQNNNTTLTFTLVNPIANTVPLMGVTFDDPFPSGLVGVPASGVNYTGCGTPNSATFTTTDFNPSGITIAAGGTCTVAITTTVTAASGQVTNVTGNVSSLNGGPGGTATAIVSANAQDPTITVSHNGNFLQGQQGATYTVVVKNVGLTPTNSAIKVIDSLPSGFTATAITGTGWTCVLGTLTCTRSDALAATASYPPITVTVNVGANAFSGANTATVSGGGDINPSNNSATDPTIVAPGADLAITKTHSGSFTQGQAGAVYSIGVSNAGTAGTVGIVTVSDTLPSGLTATAISGSGWSCNLAQLSCSRGDILSAGGSYPPVTVTVNVAATAAPQVTNIATVSGGGDSNIANNTAMDQTVIVGVPTKIAVAAGGGQTAAVLGTYVVGLQALVSDAGNHPVPNVLVTFTAPGSGPSGTFVGGLLTATATTNAAGIATAPAFTANAAAGGFTVTATASGVAGGANFLLTNVAGASATITAVAGGVQGAFVNTAFGVNLQALVQDGQSNPVANAVVTFTAPLNGPGGTFAGAVTLVQANTNAAGIATAPVFTANGLGGTYSVTASVAGAASPAVFSLTNNGADLTVTKMHQGSFSQTQPGSYTMTVRNAGTGPTSQAVTVTDLVPAGMTPVSASGSGWSCGIASQTMTCTRNDVLAAGANYPDITLGVTVLSSAPFTITNTATVSGGPDVNLANNAGADTSLITQLPDLTLSESHSLNFTQGQQGAQYLVTVGNPGNNATSGTVTVTDTLPAALTFVSGTGTGWTCSAVGQIVTCTNPSPIGGSSQFTLTVNVANNAPSLVTNQLTVACTCQELSVTNNSASDPTPISQLADLTVTKSHTGNFVQGQNGAQYTITVNNPGLTATSGTITVTDTLPAGLSYVGASGGGWGCAASGQVVTCTSTSSLASGGSSAISLSVNVAQNAAAIVTNNVTVACTCNEATTINNSASDATIISAGVDLTIAKTHSGSITQGQTGATYTLTVSNIGVGSSSGTVTVTDTLPAGLTATAIAGAGWNCSLGSLSCTRGDALAGGGSYPPITVTVNVASNVGASVTNTASVSGGGEANTSNNTASDVTTIGLLPDLAIVKTHTGSFTQGQQGAVYTVTVSNVGVGPTAGAITAMDVLPAGLNATAMAGTGWSCTLATLSCTRSDVLAAGASYPPITVTVNVAQDAQTTLINTAKVSGGGETNLTNDSAGDLTSITAGPDLTISKTHAGSFSQGQAGAVYTLVVSNAGGQPTSGTVTVTDTLPAGLTATAIAGSGWNCTLATLTCTRGEALAAGASYPVITLTVNVAANAPAQVINTAAVSGGGEFNTANDTASDPTGIGSVADLTIVKSHTGAVVPGQTATYSLVVNNIGAGPTVGAVNVTDTLPAGLTATAISGTGWSCTLATAACTRNDVLAAGASYPPITVTINVATTVTANITNSAAVSGGGEVNTANDTASDPTAVCTFTLSEATVTLGAGGTTGGVYSSPAGSHSFTLTPGAGCVGVTWAASIAGDATASGAVPAPAWMTLIAGTSGSGVAPATITLVAMGNPTTSSRTGYVAIRANGTVVAGYAATEAASTQPILNREVEALYQQLLGREPDTAGFTFWTGRGAASLGQMADDFLTSAEAQGSDFEVLAIYQAALGRAPTQSEYATALAAIRAGGQTQAQLFASLSGSVTVAQVYQNLLGRGPTAAESAAAGTPFGAFSTLYTGSEFRNMAAFASGPDHSNPLYVDMLYYLILQRDTDPAGFSFWLSTANAGGPGVYFNAPATRLAMLGTGAPGEGFVGSNEFQSKFQ